MNSILVKSIVKSLPKPLIEGLPQLTANFVADKLQQAAKNLDHLKQNDGVVVFMLLPSTGAEAEADVQVNAFEAYIPENGTTMVLSDQLLDGDISLKTFVGGINAPDLINNALSGNFAPSTISQDLPSPIVLDEKEPSPELKDTDQPDFENRASEENAVSEVLKDENSHSFTGTQPEPPTEAELIQNDLQEAPVNE